MQTKLKWKLDKTESIEQCKAISRHARGLYGVQIFHNVMHWSISWFSHDVTKIQTKKLSLLLSFYFHVVLQHLNPFPAIDVYICHGLCDWTTHDVYIRHGCILFLYSVFIDLNKRRFIVVVKEYYLFGKEPLIYSCMVVSTFIIFSVKTKWHLALGAKTWPRGRDVAKTWPLSVLTWRSSEWNICWSRFWFRRK